MNGMPKSTFKFSALSNGATSHYGRNAPIFDNTHKRKRKNRNDFVQTTSNRGLNELVPLVALKFVYLRKDWCVASVV